MMKNQTFRLEIGLNKDSQYMLSKNLGTVELMQCTKIYQISKAQTLPLYLSVLT